MIIGISWAVPHNVLLKPCTRLLLSLYYYCVAGGKFRLLFNFASFTSFDWPWYEEKFVILINKLVVSDMQLHQRLVIMNGSCENQWGL